MTYKARTLMAIILVELLLAGTWYYLAAVGAANPDRALPEYQQTLGSTIGLAMGALLGLGLVLFVIAAKRDRNRRS